VQAGVFGGQTQLNEAVEYFHVVPVETSFGVLDFQLNDEQKNALYEEGLQSASNYFREHGVADDIAVTIALKVLCDELRLLTDLPLKGLRANVALPVSAEYLRVTYSHNMASDADDRLRLQAGQTGTGDVLSIRQIRKGRTMRGLSKYDAALVREDMISLISVPVFEADHDWVKPANVRTRPRAVLAFDCNEDILNYFERRDVSIFLNHSSILLGRLLRGESLVEEVEIAPSSPESLTEVSVQFLEPTGTPGNRMQRSPGSTIFDDDFIKGLKRLAQKVVEGITQYEANGIQFR
jgi:hypothetical protein